MLAPYFEPDALSVFSKKRDLRILEIGEFGERQPKLEVRNIDGGLLVQDVDTKTISRDDLTVVTDKQPTDE